MAVYPLTIKSEQQYTLSYTFTGAAAATALVDQTASVDTSKFGGVYSSITATCNIVKAGTTDTATITLQGSNDDTNWISLVDATPNDATTTTSNAAATYTVGCQYNINPASSYGTPRYRYYRLSFTTSGTTDNKNITSGSINVVR
jgi:hypothetical protein